ncbi:MAG: hypothetical protein GX410_05280 [Elusimicrobia bacterium]|nr:hypothetical protein [Elusimicrobiota bacterium]
MQPKIGYLVVEAGVAWYEIYEDFLRKRGNMKTKYGLIMAAIMLSGIYGQKALAAEAEHPKERYESKVLIQATWGTKPGEYRTGGGEGSFSWPDQFVVDDKEHIYILDSFNNRVQHYDAAGHLIGVIPINAYLPSNNYLREEYEPPFSLYFIESMLFKNGAVYALQLDRSGKWNNDVNVLKLENDKFIKITSADERAQVEKRMTSEEKLAELKKLFKNDPRFEIITEIVGVIGNDGQVKDEAIKSPAYAGKDMYYFLTDSFNNVWVLMQGVIRKYSPDGTFLAEVPYELMSSRRVSMQGNFYLLAPYSDKPGKPEDRDFDDYTGIRLSKFSLAK